MKRLISCAEAAELDAETRKTANLSSPQLMEKASLRLWDAFRAHSCGGTACGFPPGLRIVALCGKGDNGGDAMAMLRHAKFEGADAITAVSLQQAEGGAAWLQRRSLESLGVSVLSWDSDREECLAAIENAEVILDGILGTGLVGNPRGAPLEMILACNAAASRKDGPAVISVDLPSGAGDAMGPDRIIVHADATLSLLPLKAALFAPLAAAVHGSLVSVGGIFPRDGRERKAEAFLIGAEDIHSPDMSFLPDGYKNGRGRVAVFAGSSGCMGAAKLCSRAALGAGAGYVALFADDDLVPGISAGLEEVMVRPRGSMPFDPAAWDLILAGPGWGRSPERKAQLAGLLETGLPAILDADAIFLFGELLREGLKPSGPVAITPHPGEFAAFSGTPAADALADPISALNSPGIPAALAVVLKSHVTWLRIPGEGLFVWEGMEPGLAVAGSGDVLAGLAAGLAAASTAAGNPARAAIVQGTLSDRFDGELGNALKSAVAVHGLAGKKLRATEGWFAAGDIIREAARLLGSPAAWVH